MSTLCPMPWNHQFIDGTGRVKPCCRFQGDLGYLDNNLNKTFFSDSMNNLRKEMLLGNRPNGCKRCWQEEDNGKKSLRQRYEKNNKLGIVDVNEPKIEWLELAISNNCNLMCRMCDSRYSYKLYKEEIMYFGNASSKLKHTKISVESIFPYVKNLKHLKITGGEPLITPDHWKLLDYIIENNHASHIYLNYSTNNTVYPKKHIIDRWKKFEYVELAISLDSIIDAENEYLRFGTDQKKVLQNIDRFIELQHEINLTVIARPTVSVLNVYHLPETLEWLDSKKIKHNTTHLIHPEHLSITILPLEEKNKIKNKFTQYNYKNDITRKSCEYIINYMYSVDNTKLLSKFIDHTIFLDKTRNQNFKKSYPYFDFL